MLKRLDPLLVAVTLLLSACLTSNPEVKIPSYIYVPGFTVDTNGSEMELFSNKITDVWVYLDNDYQGAYELPAKFPLAENGNHHIELRPGIKNAGIATDRRPYPYYKLFDLPSFNLKPNNTDTISPITYYDTDPRAITISWEEQFEALGPTYEISPASEVGITIIDKSNNPELIFRGKRSGAVYLESPYVLFEMISPQLTNLPSNDIPIYLEINYKSTLPFIVGLYVNNKTEQFPIYIVKEQENWNKIYLDLTTYIVQASTRGNLNISIGFTRNSSVEKAELYLDNIKLIHY